VLWDLEGLSGRHLEALAAGAFAGLVVILAAVVATTRLADALRVLHGDALRRLAQPGLPVQTTRRLVTRGSLEVGELAGTLDALHMRVRMADELGERHRRDAETAGAGVFELLSGLVAAEEGARGQLAAELHDTVAQSLAMARNLLSKTTAPDPELADCLEDAEEQVRAVMARTRPPALRDGDLASAVANLALDMRARYGLEVAVQWPESPYPLPLASAVTVYRFFQEALLNVVKHADVDDATVSLQVDEDAVLARVADQGPGFDQDLVKPDRGRHVGLGLLRERARLSGGSLDVDSRPGVGTALTLRMPRPGSAISPPPEVLAALEEPSEGSRGTDLTATARATQRRASDHAGT
ncbi:MAG: periplasmic sensor signal transduction histidine kinase, partial [Frankiales bacterium]|nr:periplasmic sensor signal transduction histidine kinase [Frankiales bacterium]